MLHYQAAIEVAPDRFLTVVPSWQAAIKAAPQTARLNYQVLTTCAHHYVSCGRA